MLLSSLDIDLHSASLFLLCCSNNFVYVRCPRFLKYDLNVDIVIIELTSKEKLGRTMVALVTFNEALLELINPSSR